MREEGTKKATTFLQKDQPEGSLKQLFIANAVKIQQFNKQIYTERSLSQALVLRIWHVPCSPRSHQKSA